MPTTQESVNTPPVVGTPSPWTRLSKRLVIWGCFFLLLYLIRDFMFVAFMTFIISYIALHAVDFGLRRLSPARERIWLRRLLTLTVFILGPLLLVVAGIIVLPPLIAQGQRMAGWLIHVSPEAEISRLLEQYVAPAEFRQQYGGPTDPRYKAALEEFRKTGESHVADYLEFPKYESWVEGGFEKEFDANERARIRSALLSEGTSSKEFETWFLADKAPELVANDSSAKTSANESPLKISPSAAPEELLAEARREPAMLTLLQSEWIQSEQEKAIHRSKASPDREAKFQAYYEEMHDKSPKTFPYSYEQYIALQKARSQGRVAFGNTVEKLFPSDEAKRESQIEADFVAAKKHEVFKNWWATSSPAQFIRNKVGSDLTISTETTARVERMLTSFLNVPIDLSTAILLSFLICIDFPRVKRACQGLRETWLKDVYDELAPALSRLAMLVGRAMQAQGLISLCNSVVMFFALTFLGVEHAMLLAVAMFVLCLVPTIGTFFAWILIASVALVQPGGGVGLALKASVAVIAVVVLEVFVFSPRILGSLMELHPVLIIAVLPVAQYFFGIWGLILATPVAVFVINVIIFGGKEETTSSSPSSPG
jgi:predicted PurR-regulated permease PerM